MRSLNHARRNRGRKTRKRSRSLLRHLAFRRTFLNFRHNDADYEACQRGCQGKKSVCQTPRNLGEVPEGWDEAPRSPGAPMTPHARQAPRRHQKFSLDPPELKSGTNDLGPALF